MRLKYRFALVATGVLLFLIVTPVLVLYARGFKVDWKNHTLIKTGALVVRTEPAKAQVFLNDQLEPSSTPASIRFLAPADYNIRVEKEGYQSWTKRLTVRTQFVTWANADREFLTLFQKTPTLVQNWEINNSSVSESNDEIAYLKNGQVAVIKVSTGEDANLVNVGQLGLPTFNPASKIKWQDTSQIFNLLAGKKWGISDTEISRILHAESNGKHLILMLNGDLYSADTGTLVLLDKTISDFSLTDDGIWYAQANQIRHYNFSNSKTETIFSDLPTSSKTEIIRTNNQIYLILDGSLYLFNGDLEKIYSPATFGSWDQTSGTFLYGNNNEIYIYHPDKKKSDLILRSITALSNTILNEQTGYLFFQNEGKIKAIELDARDHRNIFTIADALDKFTLSSDGKKLFTISQNSIKYYIIR